VRLAPRQQLDDEGTLGLTHLCECGALRGPRIDHRSWQALALEVVLQDLVAVHVARQDSRDFPWDVPTPDYVGPVAKGEVGRPHLGALEAVVDAQEGSVRLGVGPSAGPEQPRKPIADPATLVGEPEEGDGAVSDAGPIAPGALEDADEGMARETPVRDPRPLVVSGDDENRNPRVRDAAKGFEGLGDQRRVGPRAVEDISAVDDDVHPTEQGRLEGAVVVGEEVIPPPTPVHARREGEVEPQVGVCHEEDADGHASW